MSFRQTRIWRDSVSLFEYTLAALGNSPYRADIYWRLGRAYAQQQKLEEAVKQYRLSLAIDSKIPAHYLLAQALQAQGKPGEALAHYSEVLRQQPDAGVHATVAELLAERGRIPEAIAHYRAALRSSNQPSGLRLTTSPGFWPPLRTRRTAMARKRCIARKAGLRLDRPTGSEAGGHFGRGLRRGGPVYRGRDDRRKGRPAG